MRILVAYASKTGGTKGLAEMLGGDLREMGHDVDVVPAVDVRDVGFYQAVIVGGALYIFRWHRDARRFVKRFRVALRERPVWLFSSGPLDDSARTKDIPPVRFVRKAVTMVGAKGHATFGGRLTEAARGNNKALAVGDWSDPEHVREWAESIAKELAEAS
ncbi:MAG: flavodoxin domain-containing protein [Acidimicrobiia bacterium]